MVRMPQQHSAHPADRVMLCAEGASPLRLSAHRLGSVRSAMEDIKLADNLSWNDFQQAPAVKGRTQAEMSRLW